MSEPPTKSVVNMTKDELFQHVRKIARNSVNVRLSKHTRWERMGPRRITEAEISEIVTMGSMPRQPEPGRFFGEMNCRFEKRDIDGIKLGVEVSVKDDRPHLLVITVIRCSS